LQTDFQAIVRRQVLSADNGKASGQEEGFAVASTTEIQPAGAMATSFKEACTAARVRVSKSTKPYSGLSKSESAVGESSVGLPPDST
jgi:hypothetical protein